RSVSREAATPSLRVRNFLLTAAKHNRFRRYLTETISPVLRTPGVDIAAVQRPGRRRPREDFPIVALRARRGPLDAGLRGLHRPVPKAHRRSIAPAQRSREPEASLRRTA